MHDGWYLQLARQIEREDHLVNQRLTWMMQFEGFLFAALGFTLRDESSSASSLTPILAFAGISIAILTFRSISNAYAAIEELKTVYLGLPGKEYRVRPFGGRAAYRGGAGNCRLLTIVMALVWSAVVIRWLGPLLAP